ncbi:glycosyltransferase family 25 protein, partial [Hyaloscypha bicolor E]
LQFQKLLVINMSERTDRRDAVILAAAISNMNVEFVMGARRESILEDALPPGGQTESLKLDKGIKGSWRSDMNALKQVVFQNLSTVLIFEDDVDWDIRLRPQLQAFALSSRCIHNSSYLNPISKELHSVSLPAAMMDVQHRDPKISPYGDPENWDILWLGYCGAGFPRQPADTESSIGRHNILLADPNDPTVPMPGHLRAHPFGPLDALGETHEPHTRVYHRASGGALCTVACEVSQRGARRLLHKFGIKKWSRVWDVEMGDWCAGDGFAMQPTTALQRKCITSQPPIFAHHHPFGGESDIGRLGGECVRNVEMKYVRLSTRTNLEGCEE